MLLCPSHMKTIAAGRRCRPECQCPEADGGAQRPLRGLHDHGVRGVALWHIHSSMPRAARGNSAARRKTISQSTTGLMSQKHSSPTFVTARFAITLRVFFCRKSSSALPIVNSAGTSVPVRYVGEQHVREDLGRIPTAQDWLLQIKPQRWMYGQCLNEQTASSKEEVA